MVLLLLAIALAVAAESATPANMNGDYLIANPNPRAGKQYSTEFGSRAEYFDVYTPPIKTVYAEVFWYDSPLHDRGFISLKYFPLC